MPLSEPLLTVPFIGLAEFKASPTWLDLSDLIQNGTQPQEDAETVNQLLKASAWANNFCAQPLQAHTVVDQVRARVDRYGRIFLHPKNTPVRSITGLAYGADPSTLQSMTVTTNGAVWVEDQRGLVVSLIPNAGAFLGALQFGSIPASGYELFVQYQYVAGYANTYLTSATTASASSLPVADLSGFQPASTSLFGTTFGASIARIWDPDEEEAVTVASSFTPTSGPGNLPVSPSTVNAHLALAQVSEFPAEVRQAVTQYAIGLMLREEVSDDLPFPGSPGPTARRSGSRGIGGGLIDEAERLLMPFRRVR